jgi:malate dehydrogenase (oxaloacetate-decarboxylating)
MIMASAKALAAQSPTQRDKNADLLPPIVDSRKISFLVAEAVGKQAVAEGLAGVADEDVFGKELREYIWEPVYHPYERIKE